MKKTLIAVAALAATGAFAQVTVYGRLDVGYGNSVQTVDVGGATPASIDMRSNGAISAGSASSMFGIRGVEDLGGGLQANFQLEADVIPETGRIGQGNGASTALGDLVQNGSTTELFGRTSMVGIAGSFGAVHFGRDYTPLFKVVSASDLFGLSRNSTVQSAGYDGSNPGNQLRYTSPVFSGFQAMVSLGDADKTNTVNTYESKTKYLGLSGTYTNGPLYVGLATGTIESVGKNDTVKDAAGNPISTITLQNVSLRNGSLTTTWPSTALSVPNVNNNNKRQAVALTAKYDFGKFRVNAGYVTQTYTVNTITGGDIKSTEWNLGVAVPMGKVTLLGAVGRNIVTADVGGAVGSAIDLSGSDYVVGAEYALSNKTSLYAKTGVVGKLDGTIGSTAFTNKLTETSVGIRTVF